MKSSVKQEWDKLTNNDLDVIAGSKDKLAGKIQERDGLNKEEAQRQCDEWPRDLVSTGGGPLGSTPPDRAKESGLGLVWAEAPPGAPLCGLMTQ
jgi:uncharacterized protein YjbJ (UPF0337 family)